jgi:hypothetical protein
MAFSSRFPLNPPRVMAKSFPITWAHTWIKDSGMTGFTFPGIMEEPGWVSGRRISPMPQRGPEPSQRMSLPILIKLTATVLRAPLISTEASLAPWASKWLIASRNRHLDLWLIREIAFLAKRGCVFIPVPTAVPPKGSSDRDPIAFPILWMPNSTWRAYPPNSWPNRRGIASWRWVLPILRIG